MFTVTIEEEKAEVVENWESPKGSVWILGVDIAGIVFILQTPNLHPSFFEESDAEGVLGWPDTDEVGPGVYRVTMDFWFAHGQLDDDYDQGFAVKHWEPILTYERSEE